MFCGLLSGYILNEITLFVLKVKGFSSSTGWLPIGEDFSLVIEVRSFAVVTSPS
jgi:hypothetical protein